MLAVALILRVCVILLDHNMSLRSLMSYMVWVVIVQRVFTSTGNLFHSNDEYGSEVYPVTKTCLRNLIQRTTDAAVFYD